MIQGKEKNSDCIMSHEDFLLFENTRTNIYEYFLREIMSLLMGYLTMQGNEPTM